MRLMHSRVVITMACCLLVCWFITAAGVQAAGNMLLVFPQIAVGNEYNTVITLTNKGTETFYGDLEILGDSGDYLQLYVNGQAVNGTCPVTIPAGAVRSFSLSRSGATVAGHAIVYDRQSSPSSLQFGQKVDGTLVFQYKTGPTLLDSVGVTPSEPDDHFYFIAEFTSNVYTGLALSAAWGAATVKLAAYGDAGQFIDGRTLYLPGDSHQAFFMHEELSLPLNFKGTVEVESDRIVGATVLRLEGDQFSAIGHLDFESTYDFSITWDYGRTYRGEMTFSLSGGSCFGYIRFTSPAPDADSAVMPISGFGLEGSLVAMTFVQFSGTPAMIVMVSDSANTSMDTITATCMYEDGTNTWVGTLMGTRRRI